MGTKQTGSSAGYGNPPWIFTGSALYQLHLVKSKTARAFIPKEFRLVEAFGYTLGGFFLASYDDSPAGTFDELVVLAGIVWNPPTSCAWAARVLVNSDEACMHGRKDVGLPSQVARFSKRMEPIPKTSNKGNHFLSMIGLSSFPSTPPNDFLDIKVAEIKGPRAMDMCNINILTPARKLPSKEEWMGPLIKMSLPSFSGRTKHNPNLLKYSCQIECRVRKVAPAKVSGPSTLKAEKESCECQNQSSIIEQEVAPNKRNLSISVLLSKPILALQFSCLKMKVEAPTVVSMCSSRSH
ncbi:PREDICTED: protein NEOXANTHIN-DEFICIENT 1-like [Ipomoea nil]|uniref:protein NEOXANTHIN-DEFICIENT 1-like n=1 Tax=Ipomoea nil TaxID=35883 RepID=UPI00090097AC|nr:PREDICTED: protein NEOXANTHIN-DEFICIENT 1-like [Ipomoea nil]XP_019199835.1 PREDICTED: protein NEOXANTHIN-DEFICIENT 1-like [Ipomoea nil]